MKLERVLPFAKSILSKAVTEGDIAIDATIGNGHDTVFLAELVGETGHVYGFDIQDDAIHATSARLSEHSLTDRVTLFKESHEKADDCLPAAVSGNIASAIFNLGYLPGGDKEIVTKPESTIGAIEQLFSMMKQGGVIILVIYHGHPGGKMERDALLEYAGKLDQKKAHVLQYQFLNQKNSAPFVIAIEKMQA
ncbi:class I SAM-dependent methyltransferase [Metabacillus idriensis]|uniref:class I SAM-dependent methyltransferase n=1 Tax=Metabacillus idriensis TaxID=324768 RepID=UPI0028146548|nr:class I SAM-dependent methyltransferase [Metabacillus idriensis]MDR0137946.1 class I SAM-dependent methyltransferase [Metabacillus idriensis]